MVVWNEPEEPNGVVLNYTLLFYLNGGNDSGVLAETVGDKTNYVIESRYELPLIPEDLALFIKVHLLEEYVYHYYIAGKFGMAKNR